MKFSKKKGVLLYSALVFFCTGAYSENNLKWDYQTVENSGLCSVKVRGEIKDSLVKKVKNAVFGVFQSEKRTIPYVEIKISEDSNNNENCAQLNGREGIYSVAVSKADADNLLEKFNIYKMFTNREEVLENTVALFAAHESEHISQVERKDPRMKKIIEYRNKTGCCLENPALEQEADDVANKTVLCLYPTNTPQLGYFNPRGK